VGTCLTHLRVKSTGLRKGKAVRSTYDALISPESPLFACLYTIAE